MFIVVFLNSELNFKDFLKEFFRKVTFVGFDKKHFFFATPLTKNTWKKPKYF